MSPEDRHERIARRRAQDSEPELPPARPAPDEDGADALGTVAGLARIAAGAAWRTSGWALDGYLRVGRRLAGAATSPSHALRLARDIQSGAGELVSTLVNATEVGQRMNDSSAADAARRVVHDVVPSPRDNGRPPHQGPVRPVPGTGSAGNGNGVGDRTLLDEGEALLRRSRDVRYEVAAHPAYERILSELAPDEGRILRLLLLAGPQAAVDVRTGGPLGLLNSRLIAPGISMIGARAGARYVERVPSYLNNLFRLGLVWFSRETLRDHLKYQVLEAQPEVLEAIHSVAQAKVVRRSIHLTPFGEDFCRVCLMPETAVVADLPAHSDPPEGGKTASPPIDPTDL